MNRSHPDLNGTPFSKLFAIVDDMQQQKTQLSSTKREIELDFIRGIAILMVLDFHSPRQILLSPLQWLGFQNFGWAGVDIFFVLSGFLVGGLLVKEWNVYKKIDSRRFLIRRGLKIWPQYYFYLLLMIATSHRPLRKLWGNIFNIQNYVGGVAHTWTLAVEEHAYLILTFGFAFAAWKRIRIQYVLICVTVVSIGVVGLRLILASQGYNTFIRTDTRIDGIFYGVILAILYHDFPEKYQGLQRRRWVWFLIIAISLIDFRLHFHTFWAAPVNWICADATGVALLMLLSLHREGKKRAAIYRLIAWVGIYSYGIYLWHVAVLAPSARIGGKLPRMLKSTWEIVAPPTLGIMIGVFCTKLIEYPTLKFRDRIFPRRVNSAVGMYENIQVEPGKQP